MPVEHAAGAAKVRIPAADSSWHPMAKRLYNSLKQSGQAQFLEPSDWSKAALLCEAVSRELKPQPVTIGVGENAVTEMVELPPKGASLAAWDRMMTSLLFAEGDRRRLRLELERPKPGDGGEKAANVSHLDDVRRRIRGAG